MQTALLFKFRLFGAIGAHLTWRQRAVGISFDLKHLIQAPLALIYLANIIGTYLSGYLGGLMRRKYLLSGIYIVRSAAMLLFVALPVSEITVAGGLKELWARMVPGSDLEFRGSFNSPSLLFDAVAIAGK